jgi:hypothetical protein
VAPLTAPRSRRFAPLLLLLAAWAPGAALAQGDGTFRSPLRISLANPIGLAAGDFNGDAKLDLAAANGSPGINLLFQNPADRQDWTRRQLMSGVGGYFIIARDFDGDGFDDLVVSDPGSTAYFIRSRGDTTFDRPVGLLLAAGSRVIAMGDWNRDGKLDLASANHDVLTVTVYLGTGTGEFNLANTYRTSDEPHDVEALDYDGDGLMDLVVGVPSGIVPFHGGGDGNFTARPLGSNLGSGQIITAGDFNQDGKGDLLFSETWPYTVGVSQGDGTYRKTFTLSDLPAGLYGSAVDLGDLDGDRSQDLVLLAQSATDSALLVYLGQGNGSFRSPLYFAGGGGSVLVRDLDGDGREDVIMGSFDQSSLEVGWGQPGGRLLDSGLSMTGFSGASTLSVADLDRDGKPDLFVPRSTISSINVFLGAVGTGGGKPTFSMDTHHTYSSLEVLDLDGDQIPDLAGASRNAGTALVGLLDQNGKLRSETALFAGSYPSAVAVGLLAGGDRLDLALPCTGSNQIAVFLGQGDGAFQDALQVPTIERPKGLVLADLDRDGFLDLVVISNSQAAVQRAQGGLAFSPPVVIFGDAKGGLADLAVADLDGDGWPDLAMAESRDSMVVLLHAETDGRFTPLLRKVGGAPLSIDLGDLDGDGLPEVTTANSAGQSISVLLNGGGKGMGTAVDYFLGFSPLGHRLVDLDGDGVLDLVAYKANGALILLGRPQAAPALRFRRGDPNGDRSVDLADAVAVLNRLFLGGELPACEAAADANDDGLVNLSDPIAILSRLFLGGEPLPPPGPDCGVDPTPSGLPCAAGC